LAIACSASARPTFSPDLDAGADAGKAPYDDGFDPSSAYWDASKPTVDAGPALEGPIRVFAFGDTTCALVPGSVLKCWGRNAYGLVGNRDAEERDVVDPTAVSGIAPTMVAGGREHVCASDGATVWCWGRNAYGALGRGVPQDANSDICKDGKRCGLVPTAIAGLSGVRQIASGVDFSCAVLVDGTVRCWGKNDLGQLGALPDGGTFATCGDAPCSGTPVVVAGLTDVEQIAAGESAACARIKGGEIRCWGRLYDVDYGGTRYTAPTTPPTVLDDVRAGVDIAIGKEHACVVYGTSAVGCMGANRSLQALYDYDARVLERVTPRPLQQSPVGFRRVALGDAHSCGLTSDHTIYCWGATAAGQIPVSCVNPAGAAVLLTELFDATDVSTGADHTCVARANGEVHCFGRNDHGQLGGEIAGPFGCFDQGREGHTYRKVTGL